MNISGICSGQSVGGFAADNRARVLEKQLSCLEQECADLEKKQELSKEEIMKKQELESKIERLRAELRRVKTGNSGEQQKETVRAEKAEQADCGAADGKAGKAGCGEWVDRYL